MTELTDIVDFGLLIKFVDIKNQNKKRTYRIAAALSFNLNCNTVAPKNPGYVPDTWVV